MVAQMKLQTKELPEGWEDWTDTSKVSSTVAVKEAVFNNGFWSVRVWSQVVEGGHYGSPNEFQTWCVELKSLEKSEVIDGWFYEDDVQAYDKAMRLMKDH